MALFLEGMMKRRKACSNFAMILERELESCKMDMKYSQRSSTEQVITRMFKNA